MKGKNTFTKTEEQSIRLFLNELERNRTKTIRQKLRDLGFYISDFTNSNKGFTELDFDELIKAKKIIIN